MLCFQISSAGVMIYLPRAFIASLAFYFPGTFRCLHANSDIDDLLPSILHPIVWGGSRRREKFGFLLSAYLLPYTRTTKLNLPLQSWLFSTQRLL